MNSFVLLILLASALTVEARVLPRASLCGDFSLLSLSDGRSLCYRVDTRERTWREAEASCADHNAHLVAIHDSQTNDAIRRAALSEGILGGLHLGLSFDWRKEAFAWSDGSEMDFTNFGPAFPNLAEGRCVALHTTVNPGSWLNADCASKPLPSICIRAPSSSQGLVNPLLY